MNTVPKYLPEVKLLAGEHPAFVEPAAPPEPPTPKAKKPRQTSGMILEALLGQIAELRARLGEKEATAAGPTLGEVWAKYRATMKHVGWFEKSEAFVRPALERFRDRPLSELTQADWSNYIAEERSHTSKSSQGQEFKRFRAMIRWARQHGHIPPTIHPWEFGRLTHDPRRKTVIDPESFEKMAAAASPVFRVYLLCVRFGGGLRRREALLLQWSWINMETGIVRLPGKAVIDGKLQAVTKGSRARTTFLEARAIEALKLLPRIPGDDRVFVNHPRGTTYSLDWPTMEWRRLRARVGIKGAPGEVAHLHDNRGTAASDLLSRGGDLLSVCEAFGWSDMKTAERYRRSDERDVDRLATFAREARHGS